MARKSFVFYESYLESVEDLTPEEQGKITMAIVRYALREEQPDLTGYLKSIFLASKPTIDFAIQKYKNGCAGGRPSDNQDETKTKPKQNQEITKTKPKKNQNKTKGKPTPSMNNSNSSNNSNNDRLDSNTNLSTTTSQHTTTDNLFYLKFSRACACADTREDAKAEADRLQDNFKLMNLATGTVNAKFKEMPIADQLLFAIYIRYPELQTAFSFPLLEWQAQKLTSGYFPEYINRALEQISNKLDDTAAKNRQLYMAIKKFIDMDYIRNQKR